MVKRLTAEESSGASMASAAARSAARARPAAERNGSTMAAKRSVPSRYTCSDSDASEGAVGGESGAQSEAALELTSNSETRDATHFSSESVASRASWSNGAQPRSNAAATQGGGTAEEVAVVAAAATAPGAEPVIPRRPTPPSASSLLSAPPPALPAAAAAAAVAAVSCGITRRRSRTSSASLSCKSACPTRSRICFRRTRC
mmetsp:Transcript_11389/g.27752  ORF Transcript_11389/g.27752 Transcript_11389/m.27752 type:complete len:202 (+) Transcript_11389:351-956(+)